MSDSSLRLLARIRARYPVVTESIEFGALQIRFTRVTDVDLVLNQIVAECDRLEKVTGIRVQDPAHMPYWAQIWDSALAMSQYLHRLDVVQPGAWLGRCVLDLGCGMGLTGTVASALGAKVVMADLETSALLFAQLNSRPWHSRVRTRQLNWRTDHLPERFDVIVGSDILYERREWEHLEPFWRRHLKETGTVLLGEPARVTGDQFLSWITERGWKLDQSSERVAGRETPVRIIQLRSA